MEADSAGIAIAVSNHRLPGRAQWRVAVDKGDLEDAADCAATIWEQPTADVVHAMFHQALAPGAEDVFADESEALALLRDLEVRTALLPGT
ncbi:hypothetical protein [Streptomyces sp. KMM 9044]|uniref:hypothetical protein n=1 Tax=Streptomyces sp. KMM 9044 TaxID=2744474 RepID=UPI0021518DDE|nr:hypothetical protein [Streptomyces sp. KMM 9044]WAX80858.1 hypothetical protein HUV60_027525 [Streptomyces sp. KMM 9044]